MSCKTLITLALLGAATASHAQNLDLVEVMGQRVRTDVTATCPRLSEDLPRALEIPALRAQKSGSYTVMFELQGDKVSDVRQPKMPLEYRRPVAAAIRYAGCQDAAARQQPQRFGFILDVNLDESSGGGAPRYAMSFRPLQ